MNKYTPLKMLGAAALAAGVYTGCNTAAYNTLSDTKKEVASWGWVKENFLGYYERAITYVGERAGYPEAIGSAAIGAGLMYATRRRSTNKKKRGKRKR